MSTANPVATETKREIQRRLEEPLFILRNYLARAIYTMQDIDEDYFNIEGFNPDDRSQAWMLTSQYRRNAARSSIVSDALGHIRDAQLSLDDFEKWIDNLQPVGEKDEAEPVAQADTPNIRKLAKQISSSPDPDAALAMVGAIAKYGASVRAASKKKAEQAAAAPEKGSDKA